jgi:predicted secreted protein
MPWGSIEVKCAGVICGEKWEFVSKVKLNDVYVYTGPLRYPVDLLEPIVLEAPENPIIQETPRPEMTFKFWEDEATGEKKFERKITLKPPHPDHQIWWVNYSE